MGPSQKGLLLCDSFTGGHAASNGLDERRIRWAFANGVILPRRMPGGWSAKGQPCDQVFHLYKRNVQVQMDAQMGFGPTFFHSASFESMPVGPTGELWLLRVAGPHYIAGLVFETPRVYRYHIYKYILYIYIYLFMPYCRRYIYSFV